MKLARIAATLVALALPLQAAADIDIQEIISPGGIEAWLVEDRSIPFVALEFWFPGGSTLEPAEQRGAT